MGLDNHVIVFGYHVIAFCSRVIWFDNHVIALNGQLIAFDNHVIVFRSGSVFMYSWFYVSMFHCSIVYKSTWTHEHKKA